MQLRDAKEDDLPVLRAMWQAGFYSKEFSCPSDEELLRGSVSTMDGNIVAWAGYEVQVEVKCLVNTNFSVHERGRALMKLHGPIAEKAISAGADKAYLAVDPSPHFAGFGTWLNRHGWNRALWQLFWITKDEVKARINHE